MPKKPKPTRRRQPTKSTKASRWIRVIQRKDGSCVVYYIGVYDRKGRQIEAHCMSVQSLKATITRWIAKHGMPRQFRAFVGSVGLLDWFIARHGRPSEMTTGNVRIRTEPPRQRPAKANRPKEHAAVAGDPFREGDRVIVKVLNGNWQGDFERDSMRLSLQSGTLQCIAYEAARIARRLKTDN